MKRDKKAKNLKTRKHYWIGIIMILAGVSLAFSPFIQNKYYEYKHSTETKEYLEKENFENVVIISDDNSLEKDYPENLEPESGLLEIPSLNLEIKVGYGVDEENLKEGPGFYPQSGYPDTGNVSIAGHRNVYGSPFWHLDKLKAGDEILLTYKNTIYKYVVDDVFITHSKDWSVIDPTSQAALTLTTCDPVVRPPGGEYDRLIVRAYLDSTK